MLEGGFCDYGKEMGKEGYEVKELGGEGSMRGEKLKERKIVVIGEGNRGLKCCEEEGMVDFGKQGGSIILISDE